MAFAALALFSLPALTGCPPNRLPGEEEEPDLGDNNPVPTGSLTVTPPDTTVALKGNDVTIALRAASKDYGDVTAAANWSISDNSIGAIVGGKLTVRGTLAQGGNYIVTASYRNETGTALVRVQPYLPDVVEPGAPPDAKDWFGGPGGGPAPTVAYPFDNTMMAPNILQMRIQWTAPAGQTVFRVQASGPSVQRAFYVKCSGQCTYNIDDKLWSSLARSSLNQEMTLVITGTGSMGGQTGSSTPVRVRFSPEDVRGGLYYFSPTITGIKRVPLGASAPVDFIRNGFETGCAGCHGISRDGKQVAVEFGSGDTRTGSTIVDGANPMQRKWPLTPNIAWNYAWFNPSGDRIITNWRSAMILRSTTDGAQVGQISNAQIGGSYGAAMPEWSPDGRYIAMVRNLASATYDFEIRNSGDIIVIPYNNGAFGQATTLIAGNPATDVHIWPTWSPDSKWLVFNSYTCGGNCNSYNARTTRLRMVRAIDDAGNPAANPQPIELLEGTYKPNNTNNWPKFAPFLQQNRVAFVVYSASYPWGFQGGRPQLFMFGVDLDKAKAGQDASYKPIWLPFQDPATGNHSAIWTTDVACVKDSDCPGEFQCTQGMCVPRLG